MLSDRSDSCGATREVGTLCHHLQSGRLVVVKQSLRTEFLARRRAMPAPDRAAADLAILARVTDRLRGIGTVAAYAPVGAEPGGPGLPDALRAAGLEVLLPVLQSGGDLDWATYDGTLAAGPLGLRQPPGPLLGPEAVTRAGAVLVPAVAVDRRGVRLGRGGGSYDRALARLAPGVTATALLYDAELVDVLPEEPHDRRVGAVVTPAGDYSLGAPAGTGRTSTPSTG
jgi:5-formyltetrahydrofolate cyclo-ligase